MQQQQVQQPIELRSLERTLRGGGSGYGFGSGGRVVTDRVNSNDLFSYIQTVKQRHSREFPRDHFSLKRIGVLPLLPASNRNCVDSVGAYIRSSGFVIENVLNQQQSTSPQNDKSMNKGSFEAHEKKQQSKQVIKKQRRRRAVSKLVQLEPAVPEELLKLYKTRVDKQQAKYDESALHNLQAIIAKHNQIPDDKDHQMIQQQQATIAIPAGKEHEKAKTKESDKRLSTHTRLFMSPISDNNKNNTNKYYSSNTVIKRDVQIQPTNGGAFLITDADASGIDEEKSLEKQRKRRTQSTVFGSVNRNSKLKVSSDDFLRMLENEQSPDGIPTSVDPSFTKINFTRKNLSRQQLKGSVLLSGYGGGGDAFSSNKNSYQTAMLTSRQLEASRFSHDQMQSPMQMQTSRIMNSPKNVKGGSGAKVTSPYIGRYADIADACVKENMNIKSIDGEVQRGIAVMKKKKTLFDEEFKRVNYVNSLQQIEPVVKPYIKPLYVMTEQN